MEFTNYGSSWCYRWYWVGTTGDAEYNQSTLTGKFVGDPLSSDANKKGQNQVVLSYGASESDDAYNDYVLYINGGDGSEIGQVKRIVDYVGESRKVTLNENLDEDDM